MNVKVFFKKFKSTIIFSFFFLIIVVPVLFIMLRPKTVLPVYSPADVNPLLVDESLREVNKDHKIADFKLINQNGDTITKADFRNRIYVADFFFTRCQTICPVMAVNMKDLQDHFINDPDIKFLSHSVTPIMDSVPILKAYAKKKGAIDGKWEITTGDKKHIYELARKSYFAVLDEGDGGDQDFIHTEQFILIDKKFQIRGFYDGTDKSEIPRIIRDIDILRKEYN
jgi:protein SCO1/2